MKLSGCNRGYFWLLEKEKEMEECVVLSHELSGRGRVGNFFFSLDDCICSWLLQDAELAGVDILFVGLSLQEVQAEFLPIALN